MTTHRRRFSAKYIDDTLGQIVLVRPDQPVVIEDCTNIGQWTGSKCMMPAEPGTDRCKLHPRTTS